MKRSIATVSLSGDLADKLEAISRAGFRRRRDFRERLPRLRPLARGRRRDGSKRRPGDHGVSALSRFRGYARGPTRPKPSTAPSGSSISWRRSAPISSSSVPTSLRRRLAASIAPPPICASLASGPPSEACVSATRRWRGAASSTIIAMRGRSSGELIIPPSVSSSTASIRWRARSTSTALAPFRRKSSFWFNSPTRRNWIWTSSRGAATSATCRARATSPSSISCAP